mmetsp:Transcript_27712/g.90241  ORF Transcript_27712/g.90241 Transcript_27712/m.90241 type:complete len:207 (-) Transcript_27712:183-803(-)
MLHLLLGTHNPADMLPRPLCLSCSCLLLCVIRLRMRVDGICDLTLLLLELLSFLLRHDPARVLRALRTILPLQFVPVSHVPPMIPIRCLLDMRLDGCEPSLLPRMLLLHGLVCCVLAACQPVEEAVLGLPLVFVSLSSPSMQGHLPPLLLSHLLHEPPPQLLRPPVPLGCTTKHARGMRGSIPRPDPQLIPLLVQHIHLPCRGLIR